MGQLLHYVLEHIHSVMSASNVHQVPPPKLYIILIKMCKLLQLIPVSPNIKLPRVKKSVQFSVLRIHKFNKKKDLGKYGFHWF